MEYIGKAEKFWTLWEVWEETHHTQYGQPYKAVHHQYIKNISFDLDKAKDKHPNAIVDQSLRGHSSWISYDYPTPPVDEFRAGKYRGEKIADCTDLSYLLWAWDNGSIIPYESREIAIGILEKNGYRKINDSKIANPEEVAEIEKSFEDCSNWEEILEKEGKLTINCPKNLNEEGNLYLDNMTISFPNYKEMEYAGYYYGLPINSKGQAKRIKNKEIEIIPETYETEISKYGWGATLNIVVKDFNIK